MNIWRSPPWIGPSSAGRRPSSVTWRTGRSSRKCRLRDLRYLLVCKYWSGLEKRGRVHKLCPSFHRPSLHAYAFIWMLLISHISSSLPPSLLPSTTLFHKLPVHSTCPPPPVSVQLHKPPLVHPSSPFHVFMVLFLFILASLPLFFSPDLDPVCPPLVYFCRPHPLTPTLRRPALILSRHLFCVQCGLGCFRCMRETAFQTTELCGRG